MCRLHSPIGFIVEPPNSVSVTDELLMGVSPICVMTERSSSQRTLQVSSADLKEQISANHCLAFVCSKETSKQEASKAYTGLPF